jgi:hypothetical protein
MVMNRHTHRRTSVSTLVSLVAVLGVSGMFGGCAASPWESSYNGVSLKGASLESTRVIVRDVPWERYESTQAKLESMRAQSDVHKDDWSEAKKNEYKALLLQGLQVQGDPAGVEILGSSMFRSTTPVRPNSGELSEFAASIGATRVVWASRGLGKRNVVVREPVWSYSTGSDLFRDQDDGSRRSSTYTESTTTWVPVVIEEDETAWVAYFLRMPGDVSTASK